MNAILSDAFDIGTINKGISYGLSEMISETEAEIEKKVEETAQKILEKGEKLKIVLVSGRSASGKTTFTRKVCEKLSEKGREARHIALDDFLLGRDTVNKLLVDGNAGAACKSAVSEGRGACPL